MEFSTDRLTLRELRPDDLPALLGYHSQPKYTEYVSPGETSEEQSRKLFGMFLQWRDALPRENYQLAVCRRDMPERMIGCCGLRCSELSPGIGEFGIELEPSCWGQGYASEASSALLAFGFHGMRLQAILAVSVTENSRISRMLGEVGFRPMRRRAPAEWLRTRGWSETEWQVTVSEWKGRKAAYDLPLSRQPSALQEFHRPL